MTLVEEPGREAPGPAAGEAGSGQELPQVGNQENQKNQENQENGILIEIIFWLLLSILVFYISILGFYFKKFQFWSSIFPVPNFEIFFPVSL